jgi:Flp pilus assembly protein TadG
MLLPLVCHARKSRFVWRGKKPYGAQTASIKPRKRWGATTVEMAVVAPFVFLIILGIIEAARGIMVVHLLNNAAQAGCRTGIIEGKSTAAIQTVVVNALTTAGLKGETASVKVNDGSSDASTAQAGDEITVLVTIPVSSFSWVPVPKYLSGSVQGQYTMRRE